MSYEATKARWDTAYINDLPDSAFAVILPGGEKDDEGKTVPRSLRKLPHHDASGAVDMAHLRNATSREPQTDMAEAMHARAHAHLMRHADAEGMGKALLPLKASPLDDDAFRLLAIPFGGPIPHPAFPDGVDIDGETFTPRTDIKPDWLSYRVTDWHHGSDGLMRRTPLGKAIDLGRFDGPSKEPDEDGWWVTVWLHAGEKRLELIRRLAERGAQIYGSSESVAGLVRKADTGEILVWPYWRQTLSTSPQNTLSVLRPLKAGLAALDNDTPALWQDLEIALRDLGSDLHATSLGGEHGAKAGRVLSGVNLADLTEALAAFDVAMARVRVVIQPDYERTDTP